MVLGLETGARAMPLDALPGGGVDEIATTAVDIAPAARRKTVKGDTALSYSTAA